MTSRALCWKMAAGPRAPTTRPCSRSGSEQRSRPRRGGTATTHSTTGSARAAAAASARTARWSSPPSTSRRTWRTRRTAIQWSCATWPPRPPRARRRGRSGGRTGPRGTTGGVRTGTPRRCRRSRHRLRRGSIPPRAPPRIPPGKLGRAAGGSARWGRRGDRALRTACADTSCGRCRRGRGRTARPPGDRPSCQVSTRSRRSSPPRSRTPSFRTLFATRPVAIGSSSTRSPTATPGSRSERSTRAQRRPSSSPSARRVVRATTARTWPRTRCDSRASRRRGPRVEARPG